MNNLNYPNMMFAGGALAEPFFPAGQEFEFHYEESLTLILNITTLQNQELYWKLTSIFKTFNSSPIGNSAILKL